MSRMSKKQSIAVFDNRLGVPGEFLVHRYSDIALLASFMCGYHFSNLLTLRFTLFNLQGGCSCGIQFHCALDHHS